MSAFKQAVGERLIVARFHRGRISQEALAEIAGIGRTQISFYETGSQMPMLDTFVKLAGALDLSAGQLLGPIRWVPGAPGHFVLRDDA